ARAHLARVDAKLRRFGRLVRIADAREFLDHAGARLRVKALAVAFLADFERGRDVHFDETTRRLDHLAHFAARAGIRRDRRADGDAAVLRDLARNKADAANVDIAVFLREAEFA